MPAERILCRHPDLRRGELSELVAPALTLCGAPHVRLLPRGFGQVTHTATAGRDDRNFLFKHMVAVALELVPMVLMENVPECNCRQEKLSFLKLRAC